MIIGWIRKLFRKSPKIKACPKCGGELYYPQVKDSAPLLGVYLPRILMCANHKDGDQYRLLGTRTCDYARGSIKSSRRAMVALPANMPIQSSDLVAFKYHVGSAFYVELAAQNPKCIGLALWETRELGLVLDKEVYMAFRWYEDKEHQN